MNVSNTHTNELREYNNTWLKYVDIQVCMVGAETRINIPYD